MVRKVTRGCEGPGCDVRKAPYRMVADQFLCAGCFTDWRARHNEAVALATLGVEDEAEEQSW